MLALRAPVQLAYHVPDPATAAAEYTRRYGWGPFFLMEHIPLASCLYRGQPGTFDHSSAYGQAGDIMVELITAHGTSPNLFNEPGAPPPYSLHHVAHFAKDFEAELAAHEAQGEPVAMRALTTTGVEFAMVDTRARLGHYLELYPPVPALVGFYSYVKKAANGWDGSNPLRRL